MLLPRGQRWAKWTALGACNAGELTGSMSGAVGPCMAIEGERLVGKKVSRRRPF